MTRVKISHRLTAVRNDGRRGQDFRSLADFGSLGNSAVDLTIALTPALSRGERGAALLPSFRRASPHPGPLPKGEGDSACHFDERSEEKS